MAFSSAYLRRVAAVMVVAGLAAVAIADLASKGASATALAWMPTHQQQPILIQQPMASGRPMMMQGRPMIIDLPQGSMMRQAAMMRQRAAVAGAQQQQQQQRAVQQPIRLINIPGAGHTMFLNDGALNDLYTEAGVEPYVWVGAHADGYDPETQNAWADLPMDRAAIKEAEGMGFAGTAEKSMSHPTPYVVPFNAWDYLPEKEEKSLSTHTPGEPPVNVWADIPMNP